jgi:hypothetical protein
LNRREGSRQLLRAVTKCAHPGPLINSLVAHHPGNHLNPLTDTAPAWAPLPSTPSPVNLYTEPKTTRSLDSLVAHHPEALLGCHHTPKLITLCEGRLNALRHGVLMRTTCRTGTRQDSQKRFHHGLGSTHSSDALRHGVLMRAACRTRTQCVNS